MVLALSALYVRFGGLPWIRGAFYGIGAAVIAVIARSAVKLARKTVARDWLLWVVLAVNAALTAWTEKEIVWVVALSGVLVWLVQAPPRWSATSPLALSMASPFWFLAGVNGVASWPAVVRIAAYFGEAGVFMFVVEVEAIRHTADGTRTGSAR